MLCVMGTHSGMYPQCAGADTPRCQAAGCQWPQMPPSLHLRPGQHGSCPMRGVPTSPPWCRTESTRAAGGRRGVHSPLQSSVGSDAPSPAETPHPPLSAVSCPPCSRPFLLVLRRQRQDKRAWNLDPPPMEWSWGLGQICQAPLLAICTTFCSPRLSHIAWLPGHHNHPVGQAKRVSQPPNSEGHVTTGPYFAELASDSVLPRRGQNPPPLPVHPMSGDAAKHEIAARSGEVVRGSVHSIARRAKMQTVMAAL